jgi:N-acyl-D-aspartate/D-glutamate deacylase
MPKLVKLTKDLEYKGKTYKKGSTWQLVQIDDREKIACLVNRKHVRIVVSSRDFIETTFRGRTAKIAVWESKNKNTGQAVTVTLYLDNYGYHYETWFNYCHVAYLKDTHNAMEAITITRVKHLNKVLDKISKYNDHEQFDIVWVNKNYVD